ncbi:DNA/RNA helicase (AAA domain) [Campylobacter lari]|uniref:DEAD/DEAH box helicase n=1 Tax=Campylobacter lari TaxID=201 RepID=UPI002152DC22|nr:AAA domain-containing protein [Campylobacter lari]MCR6526403.1 AAA domain-containing protein [Campylobacter lari]
MNNNILRYLLFVEYLTPQSVKKIPNSFDINTTSFNINDCIKNNIENIYKEFKEKHKNTEDYSLEIIIQGAIYENKILYEKIIEKFNILKTSESHNEQNQEYASFVLIFNGKLNFKHQDSIVKFDEFNLKSHKNFTPVIDDKFCFNSTKFYLSTAPWIAYNIDNIDLPYHYFTDLSQEIAKDLFWLPKNTSIEEFYHQALEIIKHKFPLFGEKLRVSINFIKDTNENVFLNSFYIQDLTNIINNYDKNKFAMIDKYLNNNPTHRIDLNENPLDVLESYINELTLSSFASKFALMYSQQFAVNKILKMHKEHNEIYSINGPPGTGKTTLIKDIIAGIITQRAIEISKLNCNEILKKEGEIYKLNKKLQGYEIILASSNNKAVENISKEIPNNNSIDNDCIEKLDYFSEIATNYLNFPTNSTKNKVEAWGLICGILGNKSNKNSFINYALKDFKTKEGEFIGLINYINNNKSSSENFDKAKYEFNEALYKVKKLLDNNKKYKNIIHEIKTFYKLKQRKKLFYNIIYLYKVLKHKIIGKDYKKDIENNIALINEIFYLNDAENREKSSFFMIENDTKTELFEARNNLFIKALNLHKAAILYNNDKFKHNLEKFSSILENSDFKNLSRNDVLEIWKSLFFIIPSVSSTYASFGTCFKDIKHNEFGYLISDESGQSTITSAIGAIYRVKKAIIIGDPLQLEPIINIPNNINNFLMNKFNIDQNFNIKEVSLQSRCDFFQKYGINITNKIWVGSPLRVHNRCDMPIFKLSNQIAYNNMMIYGKKQKENILELKNTWYDIKEEDFNGNCNEKEIEYLNILLDKITLDYDNIKIGIITPFIDIKQKLQNIHKKYKILDYDKIGTIHTMQGKEADMIILILGGSSDGARNWVAAKPNLINVALTRAKIAIYIIGNKEKYTQLKYFEYLKDMYTITP